MSEENKEGFFTCPVMCWAVGILMAIATYLIFAGRLATGTMIALLAAIAMMLIVYWVLKKLFCIEYENTRAPHVHDQNEHEIAASRADVAAVDSMGPSSVAASATDTTAQEKAAARAAEDKALAEAKAAKSAADAKAAKAKAAAEAKSAADAKAAKDKAAADAKATKAKAAKGEDYDGDGIVEGENEGTRPEALKAARAGGADDLKKIKGVGPKMEQTCNELGFYHFDQIAAWSAQEIAWVNANLKGFKGRVTRDDWVAQAKLLAAGKDTEFSKKVDKGGVY